MSTEDTVLKVEGVSKRFGGLQALSDVGITIRRGQVYGLIGPNGAGKTTFFNVITGLYTPDSGSFELAGQALQADRLCTRSPRPASRARSRTSGCLPI
jgi:branched-chain amino acid transport system ATP-binding protein